ncbi:hypothetical protein GCM10012284_37920 [Mangrovihabitans endophyticus]|uniref:Uncharacterized protein n=1 Tax=Mangrovihabitans endophyticus TaxID=1751298 RepID=A0A8J3C128_9ACTN|nr:hypothetical protein GCM10012284_37920 [Mangrovihabitans endophyticus]
MERGPQRPGDQTTIQRILLVHAIGGTLIGAGCGSFFTVLGLVIGAMVGFNLGIVAGLVAVALMTYATHRRPGLPARTARLVFLVPAVLAMAFPLTLWTMMLRDILHGHAVFAAERVMMVVLLLPGPLGVTLISMAAGWCLEATVPAVRRPRALRHALYGALPALLLVVVGGPLGLSLTTR